MKSQTFLFYFLLCLPILVSSQFYNKEVEAKIYLEVVDNNILKIVGSAYNKTEINKSLRYVLSVIKSTGDSTNVSKNNQEGRLVLEPGAKKNLSSTAINVTEEDRTIIFLLVYDEEDKIVGKDRKVLNGVEGEVDAMKEADGNTGNQDVKESKEDAFVLKGMVIEDMKTKAGRDFYDMFYSAYLARNINGEKIVKVEEKPAIANNTQIQVLVGDIVVMQFIMNPRSQYLDQMVEQSIYRVNLYFQQLRNRKDQVTRY